MWPTPGGLSARLSGEIRNRNRNADPRSACDPHTTLTRTPTQPIRTHLELPCSASSSSSLPPKMAPRRRKGAPAPSAAVDDDDLLLSHPPPPLSPLTFLFGLALGVALGVGAAAYAHGRHADVPLDTAVRTLWAAARDGCRLGELCADSARRPLLGSGKESSAVWDLPRYHMKTRFEQVKRVYPGVEISFLWDKPMVVFFDGALNDKEIDLVLDIATPRFRPSTIVQLDGSSQPDESRTSDTAWLYFDERDKVVAPIVAKLASFAGFSPKNAESLGVNRYRPGQYFRLHHDWMDEIGVESDPVFPKGCQRAATVLAYLSDTEEGGETVFVRDPEYDFVRPFSKDDENMLVVKPKKGRVLIWFDEHPYTEKIDPTTLHGGQPVITGTKRKCPSELSTLHPFLFVVCAAFSDLLLDRLFSFYGCPAVVCLFCMSHCYFPPLSPVFRLFDFTVAATLFIRNCTAGSR